MSDAQIAVRLALQTALLGAITTEIVAVAAAIEPERLIVRVYTDQPAPQQLRERFDASVITELYAAAPFAGRYEPSIEPEFAIAPPGSRVPDWGALVYLRAT